MKKYYTNIIVIVGFSILLQYGYPQNSGAVINTPPEVSALFDAEYDADHPEISVKEYAILDERCAENIKLLGLDKIEKSTESVTLEWPMQAATGFTDCSYYAISAHVDHNTAAGAYQDYNCGTIAYDGHKGTDIMPTPFGFYKMDNDQVEIIAAAAGTILDKDDGNYDRNCTSNSLPANYVIIQHADGSIALYWHMKSGSVTTKAVGQTVVAGEYLGVPGSSGSSSGPHLHFEIWSGSSSSTYNDPYSGTCNTINANSWWANQKPYTEPAVIKASVHTTDIVLPGCPNTETPNESTSYTIPFQGAGLPAGYAKFYIFMRNTTAGMTATMSILNPGGTTFSTWNYTTPNTYNASYAGWSKLLPTIDGTYTFQASYNGIICSQNFDILTITGVPTISETTQAGVFYNQSNGNLIVETASDIIESYTLEIFNVIGERVYQKIISGKSSEINLNLQSGIYLYQLTNENNLFITGKIAIQ